MLRIGRARTVRFGGGRSMGLGTGGGSGPVAGTAPTAFALAPTVAYHPNSQTASLSSGRVTSCPDRMGVAALAATLGPYELTDALGRKFWRFTGAEFATIANTLTGLSARALGVFMVVRMHKHKGAVNFFSPRYSAYTDDTTNTAYSGGSSLRGVVLSSSAPFLYGAGISSLTDAVNGYKMLPGTQMAVVGIASRTTANGGQRVYCNNDVASIAQSGVTSAACVGGVIAGVPAASNAVTASGNWFDLYEFGLWSASLTNAQADAIAAAMVANYAIPAITSQLVLDGDSITDGIPTTLATIPTSADNIGMQLTAPGAALVDLSRRVINIGASGNQTSNLATKKNATGSVFRAGLFAGGPAANVVALQIGRNDVAQTGGQKNSGMLYADVVALLNNATGGNEGYLQLGFSVKIVANIAGPASSVTTNVSPAGEDTLQKRIEGYRALIMDGSLLPTTALKSDTLSGAGQTFDGLVGILPLSEVTVAADTKFKTAADALDSASGYYDSDQTHLRVEGISLMASGGDTPTYGYGALA